MESKLRVYLASRFEHASVLRKIRDEELVPRGIEVTSRWLELEERADVKAGDWNTARKKRDAASIDLDDIDKSDVVVFDVTFDKRGYKTWGAMFEAGYTCGLGLPLILIGDNGSIFFELPFVRKVENWEEAIELLQHMRNVRKK